jgi:ABC-type multidrug transport system fused ATPase/permease subunit
VFCGLFVIVLITPTQTWVGEFFDKTRDAKAEAMDSRVLLMTEILSNIKTIKLYGYESGFKTKVEAFRDKEIALLRKSGVVMSFLSIVFTCLPLFIAFVSFAVYATVGGPNFTPGIMNAQVVFVSLSLFGLLQHPLGSMPNVTESTVSLRVSTRRIQKFLLREELDPSAVQRDPILPKDPKVPVIQITDATFAWASENPSVADKDDSDGEEEEEEEMQADETTSLLRTERAESSAPALVDINVYIARGQLTAVVGRVGQGKSSLLSAIIGDMYKRQGSVKIYGSVAYVSQQAWICNATVRDNIIFGKPFDQERYDRVLFASGLLPDLEILAAGDMTEIGERGINLSGGQKQRVSLARAAYQDADVYLMDDPLSAVDAHVDQHLWEHLIGPKGLLKDKTRLLVTHGISHLEHVDHILVVKEGHITEAGHYKQLMTAKKGFYQLIKDFSVSHRKKRKNSSAIAVAADADTVAGASSSVGSDEDETRTVVSSQKGDKKDDNGEDADGELVKDEEAHAGIVGWDTFKVYCEAM